MKQNCFALSLCLACISSPLWAAAGSPNGSFIRVADAQRHEVRRAVETHRASQREEVRREEEAAGRRLTPAELAELRSQVRQQWSPRHMGNVEAGGSVGTGSHGGIGQGEGGAPHDPQSPAYVPPPTRSPTTMPRSQRP